MSPMNHADDRHAANSGAHPVGGSGKKYLIASVVLHVLVLLAFAFSWSFSSTPEIVVPKYLEARVATQEDLAPLKERKEEAQRKQQEELAAQRRAQEEKKRQQAEARKKREAEAKAREAAKKEAERKKALIAKQKKEQELKEREEAERKAREKEALARKEKERKEQARREREQALAERLAEAEREAAERAAEAQRQSQVAAVEASETERYMGLIKRKIEDRWHKPPNSKNLTVVLDIELFPTGELRSVKISKSSGNAALDQSAQVAVRSVRRFPVPESAALFEKQFRKFAMSFTP